MTIEPARINLELQNQKVKFLGVSHSNPSAPIFVDYLPPIGDGEGFLGLDLLVMSFAGCVSTGIVAMLRKMGKDISAYKMNVTGVKKEKPLSLERIDFEIIITSSDVGDEIQEVIKGAEQKSPVWNAIKNNVDVTWQYKIIEQAK